MRYRDAAAFRQALEQRLRARAAGGGARVARDRKRVAFDRLLARLNDAVPDRWLLKGGFALDLRLHERARTTRDVDIEWQTVEEQLLDALIEATSVDVGDYFAIQVERTATPPDRLGGSHRFRVTATLAGRPFETFLLDIGLRSDPITEYDTLATPDLLAFAEIEPAHIRAIPAHCGEAARVHPSLRRRPAELAREGPHRPRPHERAGVLRVRPAARGDPPGVRSAGNTRAAHIRARASTRVGSSVPRARRRGWARARSGSRAQTDRHVPRSRPCRRAWSGPLGRRGAQVAEELTDSGVSTHGGTNDIGHVTHTVDGHVCHRKAASGLQPPIDPIRFRGPHPERFRRQRSDAMVKGAAPGVDSRAQCCARC